MVESDHEIVLKAEYVRTHGHWGEELASFLELDPRYFAAYLDLTSVPVKKGVLTAKVIQLIHLAVCANATHMYREGTQLRIRETLRAGATQAEVMEVLRLVGTLGIHAMNVGMPILDEVLTERSERMGPEPLTKRQEELKVAFQTSRGFWHEDFDLLLEMDPEMFEAYSAFSGLAWTDGALEPKVKEFIYISFDVAATHLHREGIKQHMHNALRHGATKNELLAVMEIASSLGGHAALAAAPLVKSELAMFSETY